MVQLWSSSSDLVHFFHSREQTRGREGEMCTRWPFFLLLYSPLAFSWFPPFLYLLNFFFSFSLFSPAGRHSAVFQLTEQCPFFAFRANSFQGDRCLPAFQLNTAHPPLQESRVRFAQASRKDARYPSPALRFFTVCLPRSKTSMHVH